MKKRRTVRSASVRRFPISEILFCTSFLISLVPAVPSFRPTVRSSYLWGLNNPSPFWLKELHANRKAVALQLMAVGNPGRGAKLACARNKRQPLALFPAAETDDASAARTYVLRKSRFRAGKIAMAVEEYPNLQGNSAFGAVKRMKSA